MHKTFKTRCPSIGGISHPIEVSREDLVLFIGGTVPYYVFYCKQCHLLNPEEADPIAAELLEASRITTVTIDPDAWLGEVWPEAAQPDKLKTTIQAMQLGPVKKGFALSVDIPDHIPEDWKT